MLKPKKKKKPVCKKCGTELKKFKFYDCAYYTCIQATSTVGVLNGKK